MTDDESADPVRDVSTPEDESVEPTSHSSSTWKVLGRIDQTDGVGVLGHATSGSGTGSGVAGVTDADDDGAAGVAGEATGTSTRVHGVRGVTRSQDPFAAGVKGVADSEGIGLIGEADTGFGILGVNYGDSTSAEGVLGVSSSPYGSAVGGKSTAASGVTYGVRGLTSSSEAEGAGIVGTVVNTSGNAAAVRAEGRVDVDEVGCEAYLTYDQTIPSGIDETVVAFDAAPVDHFDSFDTTTGQYTVPAPGDYHVSTSLMWTSRLPAGTNRQIGIRVDGVQQARRFQDLPGEAYVTEHLSKTLFGLDTGNVIDVRLDHSDSSDQNLLPGKEQSYVTIHKVG